MADTFTERNKIIKKLIRIVLTTRCAERKNCTLMLSVGDSVLLAVYLYENLIQVPGTVEMRYDMDLEQFIDEQQYRRFKTFRGMKLEWDAKVASSCVFVSEAV